MPENTAPPEGEATTVADITNDPPADGTPPAPAATVHEPIAGDEDTIWLKLKDTIGKTVDGNLEPLADIGISVAVPQMLPNPETGELALGEAVQTLRITHAETLDIFRPARFIAGGRIVETRDQRVADALIATSSFEPIDRPTKKQLATHVKALTDAREEAGTHAQDPDHPERG